MNLAALNRTIRWDFQPVNVSPGMHVSGGDVFGIVDENILVKHKIMVHPKEKGIVKWIAPRGHYTVDVSRLLCDDSMRLRHAIVCVCAMR